MLRDNLSSEADAEATQKAFREAAALTEALIRCPSLTPDEAGCFALLTKPLRASGFECEEINRGKTSNLWASLGTGSPFLLFNGHVDVVPPGNEAWRHAPFEATVEAGMLYGRGAQDMKTSVAAFCTAAARFAKEHPDFKGKIGILITSDEEGDGKDGTVFALETLKARFPGPDYCIVGEPSSSQALGDTVKNGRRGSLNAKLTVRGVQGHVAYPEKVKNPIHGASKLIASLCELRLDEGCGSFPPSSLQVSNIRAGTGAVNVVPAACEILLNIRYNPKHTAASLKDKIEALCRATGFDYEVQWTESASPFMAEGDTLIHKLSEAIRRVTNRTPALSTAGGTSDGRFIKPWCPEVVEFGPINDRIHKTDECIPIDQIRDLTEIYYQTLCSVFLEKHHA